MLLWLLLLHLAIHLLTASRHARSTKTISFKTVDKKYVIKSMDSCPEVGYFFKREPARNSVDPGPCYLCFCQGQHTAVCWRRQNKRCDVESFHHNGLGKRATRVRRSPSGLGDIFFRDAARQVLNRITPEECKPFQSSYSDGCPPADWCIGCTVCDCDANGRWDCHLLSFCPENTPSKKYKKRKHRYLDMSGTESFNALIKTTKAAPENKLTGVDSKSAPTATTKHPNNRLPLRYQKIAPKNATEGSKNKATHNPIGMVSRAKMQKLFKSNNMTLNVAQEVVNKVMAAVHKRMESVISNFTKQIPPTLPCAKKYKRYARKGSGQNHLKKYIIRNKRNVMAINNIDLNNTVPTVSENPIVNVSETTVIPIASSSQVPDYVSTTTPTPSLNDREYYKYSIGVDNFTTYRPIVVDDEYQTETVVNLMTTERLKQLEPTIDDSNELTSFLDTIPEVNDLKFKKWSFVKILKEKTDLNKVRNIEKLIKNKPIDILSPRKKIISKDVERKFVTKKFNIVKVLNSHMMAQDDTNQNQNETTVQAIKKKIGDIQSSVSKLFRQFNKNNTLVKTNKQKRVGIVRHLKKLFSKFFNRKKTDRINEFKVIETLCDTFGPCKVNKNDKLLLKSKLKELNEETLKILKTVQIIKGLLQLVKSQTNNEDTRIKNFGTDIQTLNNILRGTYVKYDDVPLSATQETQIDYIKKNTKHFVLSVSKFATVLNEIVNILIKNNNSNTDKFHRILRGVEHKTEDDPFKKFKNLLLNYNLVQNDFMKKMYRQLSEVENQFKGRKVSENEFNDLNNSVAIERFSRSIITNLRRLKRVAQTLTSSGRVKRHAVLKEDSIEYVLMVMEYLMKQNYPLDATPVNDGIDLLIDAIRSAPDIKPIKKKVLEYTSATPIQSDSIQTRDSSDDSNSVTDIPFKDNPKSSIESDKNLEQILEEDKENEERSQFDRRAEDTTDPVYFGGSKDVSSKDKDVDTTSESPVTLQQKVIDVVDNSNTVNGYTYLKENSRKGQDLGDNDNKKFDELGESNDVASPITYPSNKDNEVIPLSDATAAPEVIQTREPKSQTEGANVRNYLDQSIESNENKFIFDTKTQIDWIEENFGMDPSRLNLTYANNTTAPLNVTKINKKPMKPIQYNVSSISSEVEDKKKKKKKKKKINPEEVMLRKHMDLLNSLDYGTEKSQFEDSDSKDSNDERYSSDSFPTYFV